MTGSETGGSDDRVGSNSAGTTYRTDYDRTDGRTLTVAVVDAVAEASDTAPTDLPPLCRYIDPDALDRLFRPTAGGADRCCGRVEFAYRDHEVTVYGDGEIVVRCEASPLPADTAPPADAPTTPTTGVPAPDPDDAE